MRNAARLALLAAFASVAACGGGDGSGPSDPVPAALEANSGNGQSATVGTAVPLAPSVIVKDQRGSPVPGIIVTFAVQTGGGAVSGAQLATDQDGIARVGAWVLGTATGPNTLRASVTGLNPVTFTATATPGAPVALAFVTLPPLSALNRVAFTTQPVLQLKDVYGNNATQAAVQVSAAIESGGGTLGGTATAATNAAGTATFTNLSIAGPYGPRTLRFSATGLTPLLSGTIELFAGTPANFTALSPTTLAGTVGTLIGSNLRVEVTDLDNNPVQGVTVDFALTAGGGNLANTSAITDADGQGYVSSWTLGTVAGQLNSVTASHGSLTPVVFSVTPVADVASRLVMVTEPGTTSAVNGALLVPQPGIRVTDQYGNPVDTALAVTAAIASGNSSLGGSPTVSTAADGTLSFSDLTITGGVGAHTLSFSAPGLTGATSASFTLVAGPAANLAASAGDGQSATVNSPVAVAPAVLVTDQSGNPVSGTAVSFAVGSGGGSATGGNAVTNASGIATVGSWTLGTTPGTNTLNASATGLAGSPVTFTATGTPGPAAQLTLTTAPSSSATNGVPLAQQPAVQVRDQYGNALSQAGVLVTAGISAGGGSVTGGTTATTDAAGLAAFSGLIVNGPVGSPQTLGFTASGLTQATSGPITLVAGAASQLLVTTQPSATAVNGTVFATQPVVQVADAGGNPLASAGVNVTVAIASGAGTLGGTLGAVTNGAGQASFTDLGITGVVGTRTLGFTATGLASAASAGITLTAGPATTIAAAAGNNQSATVNTTLPASPSVLVSDQSGNPVSGIGVTFAVTAGGGSANGTNATSGADGIATVGSWTLGTVAGTNTLTATSGGLAGSPVSFTATATPAPASTLELTTAPSGAAQSGVPFAQQPALALRDPFGNAVNQAGVTVTAVVASGSGSASGATTALTNASGVATFSGLAITGLVGNYTLSFGATGLTAVTSGTIALSAGPAAILTMSAGDGQSATVNSAVAIAPAVLVTDQAGNPVSGTAVAFAVTAGGGALLGANPVSDGSGIAAVTSWTLGTVAGSNTLTATSAGLAGSPVGFTATGTPGAPASITAQSATAQVGRVGIAATEVPGVLVEDQYGNPVPGATVTFQVTAGGGAIGNATPLTDAAGLASAGSWTFGRTVVANSVTATVAALTPVGFNATVTFEVASGAAGAGHACATTIDAIPYCWGANNSGSVGDGTSTLRLGPVPVSGAPEYTTLSVGADFSCGLTGAAAAYCWGFNGRGELGRGAPGSSDVPLEVTGGHLFSQLATNRVGGTNHACGVTTTGELYCWGDNTNGQLGDGGTSVNPVYAPVLSNSGATYTQVSAGPLFTCGVRTGGQAWCWGDNSYGQLGDSSETDRTNPVAVRGGLTFTKLAASQVHTCGVTTAGTVYCWGDNVSGRLGSDPGVVDSSLVPLQVAGLSGIVDVVAGENHTCARDGTGATFCWGDNQAGQLGDGNSGVNLYSATPVAVSLPGGVSGFSSITAGVYFTCGAASNGALYCWGDGANGRLGIGSTAVTPLPTQVIDP